MSIFLSEEAFLVVQYIRKTKTNTICFVYETESEISVEMETRELWIIVEKKQEYYYLHYFLQEKNIESESIPIPIPIKYNLREYGRFSQITNEISQYLSSIVQKEYISSNHLPFIMAALLRD